MRLTAFKFTILFSICCCAVAAQDNGELQKNKRTQYKEFRSLSAQNQGDSIRQSLTMRHWIVEIDRVPGRRGASIPIEPGMLFVAVDGNTAHLCVDPTDKSEKGCPVVQGVVEKYVVSKFENQSIYSINMLVAGQGQEISISVAANPSGSIAWVNISGKRMRKSVFVGRIVPLDYSPVYRASVVD